MLAGSDTGDVVIVAFPTIKTVSALAVRANNMQRARETINLRIRGLSCIQILRNLPVGRLSWLRQIEACGANASS
jgi:hypothetical protein